MLHMLQMEYDTIYDGNYTEGVDAMNRDTPFYHARRGQLWRRIRAH